MKLRHQILNKENTYEQKRAKISTIEAEIRLIREIIGVMREFGVDEIDLEGKEEDKDEGTSETVTE